MWPEIQNVLDCNHLYLSGVIYRSSSRAMIIIMIYILKNIISLVFALGPSNNLIHSIMINWLYGVY